MDRSRFRSSGGSRLVGVGVAREAAEHAGQIGFAAASDDVVDRPGCEHAAMMQDHDIVAGGGLVDQMRRPEDADPLLPQQTAHMLFRIAARAFTSSPTVGSSSSSRRGRCSSGARNFHPPHLAAGKLGDALMHAVGEIDAGEGGATAHQRLAAPDAMQRGVIDEVLHHRNIGVERARLKNDAELGERRARLARDVMAPDPEIRPSRVP